MKILGWKVASSPGDVVTAAVTIISLQRGDKVTVTVTSNECSGNPESVNMNGIVSGLVASGSCAGGLEEFELYVNEEAVCGFDQSSIRESVVELAQDVVAGLRPIWLDHHVVKDNWPPKTLWFWIVSPPHFSDLLICDRL